MNNSSKPVTLVFITAETCGACKNFKKRKPDIVRAFSKSNVTIVDINLEDTKISNMPSGYPTNLNKFIGFFPTVLMVDTKEWKESVKGNKTLKNVQILGGEIANNGRVELVNTIYQTTAKGIKNWVDKNRPNKETSNIIVKDFIPYRNNSKQIIISNSAEKNNVNKYNFLPL